MTSKQIILSYAPANPRFEKNRICGHTFEVMDYYLLLKDNGYNPKIVIFDKIKPEIIYKAYEDKYNIDVKNINIEFRKYNFNKINKIIDNNIWIITSGFEPGFEFNTKFYVKKLISFECEEHDYSNLLNNKNFYLLRDPRLLNKKFKKSDGNVFDYIKKINFKYYKSYHKSEDNILIYVNGFLKDLDIIDLQRIQKISNKLNKNILFVSGTKLSYNQIKKYEKFGNLLYSPVENIFEKFDTFIYTKNTRNYDCSPRFIAECKFYKKNIIVLSDLSNDIGAKVRFDDINENFNKLFLDNNDLILLLLK